ncbi:MAG: exosortase C-terminal domain/associated protein EpsI [bacterium]
MDWKKKEYWLVLCLIFMTAVYSYLLRCQQVKANAPVDFSKILYEIGEWNGKEFYFSESTLNELKADQTTFRRYINHTGNEIWLFIAYWADQKYGAQPHSPLHCLPGSGWNIQSKEIKTLEVAANGKGTNEINKALFATISNTRKNEAMLYWYQTRNGTLSNDLSVKFNLAKNSLLRKPTDVAFIRITMPLIDQNLEKTWQTLYNFWQLMSPQVGNALPF